MLGFREGGSERGGKVCESLKCRRGVWEGKFFSSRGIRMALGATRPLVRAGSLALLCAFHGFVRGIFGSVQHVFGELVCR